MPTYAYRCPHCEHRFERFLKMQDADGPQQCPACERDAERVITGGAGIVFKGSGFYITDYKKAPEKQDGAGGAKKDVSETKKASSDSGSKAKGDKS